MDWYSYCYRTGTRCLTLPVPVLAKIPGPFFHFGTQAPTAGLILLSMVIRPRLSLLASLSLLARSAAAFAIGSSPIVYRCPLVPRSYAIAVEDEQLVLGGVLWIQRLGLVAEGGTASEAAALPHCWLAVGWRFAAWLFVGCLPVCCG